MTPAKPNRATISAMVDWELVRARLDAIRDRVLSEGFTAEVAAAYLESIEQQTAALKAIDAARYATQFDPEVYRFLDGGAS